MWSEGYVTGTDYVQGYYREMSLNHLRFSLQVAGVAHSIPDVPSYLELGFGQGQTLCFNAAANAGAFFGNDFYPSHVAYARELHEASGADMAVLVDSFAELADRTDLPDFDVIALHGVWSWISYENRKHILKIIDKKLRPGGVVYVSYNCMNYWSKYLPMRHALHQIHKLSTEADVGERIGQGLDFIEKLFEIEVKAFKNYPEQKHKFDGLRTKNRQYLAHEYINDDWHPEFFSDVAKDFAAIRMNFAGSSVMLDHLDAANMTTEQQAYLDKIPDPVLKQTTRDFIVNESFRRDIYIKGRRELPMLDRVRSFQRMWFQMITPVSEVKYTLQTPLGEITLPEDIYGPIVAELARNDYEPKAFLDILQAPGVEGMQIGMLIEALTLLVHKAHLAPVYQSELAEAQVVRSQDLNRHLCGRAETYQDSEWLISPVTGSGVVVKHLEKLFLFAAHLGKDDIPGYITDLMTVQNQFIRTDKGKLSGAEELRAEITRRYEVFMAEKKVLLDRLMVSF